MTGLTPASQRFSDGDDLGREDLDRMLDLYCKTLSGLDYEPVPYADTASKLGHNLLRGTGKTDALSHAAWMCGEARRFLKQGRLDKAARWVGIVQGILWASGTFSLDELREHNRFM